MRRAGGDGPTARSCAGPAPPPLDKARRSRSALRPQIFQVALERAVPVGAGCRCGVAEATLPRRRLSPAAGSSAGGPSRRAPLGQPVTSFTFSTEMFTGISVCARWLVHRSFRLQRREAPAGPVEAALWRRCERLPTVWWMWWLPEMLCGGPNGAQEDGSGACRGVLRPDVGVNGRRERFEEMMTGRRWSGWWSRCDPGRGPAVVSAAGDAAGPVFAALVLSVRRGGGGAPSDRLSFRRFSGSPSMTTPDGKTCAAFVWPARLTRPAFVRRGGPSARCEGPVRGDRHADPREPDRGRREAAPQGRTRGLGRDPDAGFTRVAESFFGYKRIWPSIRGRIRSVARSSPAPMSATAWSPTR